MLFRFSEEKGIFGYTVDEIYKIVNSVKTPSFYRFAPNFDTPLPKIVNLVEESSLKNV